MNLINSKQHYANELIVLDSSEIKQEKKEYKQHTQNSSNNKRFMENSGDIINDRQQQMQNNLEHFDRKTPSFDLLKRKNMALYEQQEKYNMPMNLTLQELKKYEKFAQSQSIMCLELSSSAMSQKHSASSIYEDNNNNSSENKNILPGKKFKSNDNDHRSNRILPVASPKTSSKCQGTEGGDLVCVVCGSSANGYNFDAITCESCKAFFRRNAFRSIHLFRCSNNENCVVNVVTRKKCKKCRIVKCFKSGMRRDWIMTEVEREEKRKKIEENRRRKVSNVNNVSFDESDSPFPFSNPSKSMADSEESRQFSKGNYAVGSSENLSVTDTIDTAQKLPIRRRRRRRRNSSFDKSIIQGSWSTSIPNTDTNASFDLCSSNLGVDGHMQNSSCQMVLENVDGLYMNYGGDYSKSNQTFQTDYDRSLQCTNAIGSISANILPESNEKRIIKNSENDDKKCTLNNSSPTLTTLAEQTSTAQLTENACTKSAMLANETSDTDSPQDKYRFKYNFKKIILKTFEEKKQRNEQSLTSMEQKNSKGSTSFKMSSHEIRLIEKIEKSYTEAIQLVRAQGTPSNCEDINTTINLTELAVRRIINFFKIVINFNEIDHELMIVLLKNSMMSLLQINGVNSYDTKTNTFKEPDTDDIGFPADSLKTVYGSEVYELTISITRSLSNICVPKKSHIKLLLLIFLFDPYCPKLNTDEQSKVKMQQLKYVKLLYAYLYDELGLDMADLAFNTIVTEMNKVNKLSKIFKSAVDQNSDTDIIRPLMKEIFSLDEIKKNSANKDFLPIESINNENDMSLYSLETYNSSVGTTSSDSPGN